MSSVTRVRSISDVVSASSYIGTIAPARTKTGILERSIGYAVIHSLPGADTTRRPSL